MNQADKDKCEQHRKDLYGAVNTKVGKWAFGIIITILLSVSVVVLNSYAKGDTATASQLKAHIDSTKDEKDAAKEFRKNVTQTLDEIKKFMYTHDHN